MVQMSVHLSQNSRKRVFILGAGFSKAANLPLSSELTSKVIDRVRWSGGGGCDELARRARYEATGELCTEDARGSVSIEQLAAWINDTQEPGNLPDQIEDALLDALLDAQHSARTLPIDNFARHLRPTEEVLTFNFDCLLEQSLQQLGHPWSFGFGQPNARSVVVRKLHGSLDWTRPPAGQWNRRRDAELLVPASGGDHDLYRLHDPHSLTRFRRDMTQPRFFRGMAGVGAKKDISLIPGLAAQWEAARRTLACADDIIVVGFAMTEFDKAARSLLKDAISEGSRRSGSPPRVIVVDPFPAASRPRFAQVCPVLHVAPKRHEDIDWATFPAEELVG